MAELTAVFALGLVFGGLIVAAWKSDAPRYSQEPTEAGREFQDSVSRTLEQRSRRVQ